MGWKRCAVSGLVVALGAGLLAACGPSSDPPAPAPARASRAATVRVAAATTGTIRVSTPYVAVVAAKDQVNLVPLVTGRLERLDADIGSEVQKGQVIAELSHGTLDAQLQQARAGLRNVQAKLASAQAATKPNQIKAQAQLDAARAKLRQLMAPSALDLQAAQSAVDKAQADLENAKTKLDQLKNPSAPDLAAAQSALADAQSKFITAQANVDQAITKALSSKDSMPSEARTWWQLLLQARLSLEANAATLDNLQPAFGWSLTPAEIAGARQIVSTNQEVISNLLAQINSSSLIPQEIRSAMWSESSAQAALDNTRVKLKELQNPSQNTVALAQSGIDSAQASLDSAVAKLKLLKNPNLSDVAAAEAATSVAEQALVITEEPYTRQDIEAAQAQVDQAQGQVNLVQQQLSEVQLLAPFDGFVTQRLLAPGAIASPQTPVVTVVSKTVVLSLRVEETSINSFQIGQPVTFTSPVLPGQSLAFRVDQIAPIGDERAHTFLVQMRPAGATRDLKPGMSGQVSVPTQHDHVVLVPKEAVQYQGGQPTLFVVQDGKARLRPVAGGLIDDKNMEVQSGVQADDQVVVSGQNQLNEGDPVTIEAPTERRRPQG